MSITESLTVQILGDSSDLQQELEQVAETLGGLQQQLSEVSGGTGQFANALQGLSSAVRPLQGISHQLAGISRQIEALGQQQVRIDVSPALDSLQQLIHAAQMAAEQLAALNLLSLAGGMTGGGGGGPQQPARGFASGGLVSGPSGVDQIPARLSAGEYVLNQRAVAAVGIPTLDRLNAGGTTTRPRSVPTPSLAEFPQVISPSFDVPRRGDGGSASGRLQTGTSGGRLAEAPGSSQTNNHFGGIEIHVRETADVGEVMRDLRVQGIHLRHRRG